MYKRNFLIFGVFILSLIFVFGCKPAPEVTPTIEPSPTEIELTNTPIPTATSEPTNTYTPQPTSTATLEPTPTFTPTIESPSLIGEYLKNPIVVKEFGLGYTSSFMWEYENGKFSGGQIVLNNTPGWDAYFITKDTFSENHAILARFSRGSGSNYNIGIQTGEFDTPSFRGWSVHGGDVSNMSNRHGGEWLGYQPLIGNITLKANDWYYILLAAKSDGEFLAVVWDANDPTRVIHYDQVFGEEWTGKDWSFRIGAKGGEVYLDTLMLISFDGFQ